MSAPAFNPVTWIGGYSMRIPPTSISIARETNVATKPTPSGLDQSEGIGYSLRKLTLDGFFSGTTSQPLSDLETFLASSLTPGTSGVAGTGDGYYDRPFSVALFNQDNSGTNSSQPIYSDIVYLQNFSANPKAGTAMYEYGYTMSFIQASPVQYFATTTAIANGTTAYAFNMSSTDINSNSPFSTNGYIAGVMLLGAAVGTNGTAVSASIVNNSSATVGTVNAVGTTGNQLMGSSGSSQTLQSGPVTGVQYPNITLPALDTGAVANQSVEVSGITGTYTITFGAGFVTGHLPSAIYLVWVPL